MEVATCPNWVLSWVDRSVAGPNQEISGCRWCHRAGMTHPVASDFALKRVMEV